MQFRLDADMPTTCSGRAESDTQLDAARAEGAPRGDGRGRRGDARCPANAARREPNKNPATGNRRVDTSGWVVHPLGLEDLEESSPSLSQVASQSAGGDTALFQPGAGFRKQLSQSSKRVRFLWSQPMSRSMHGASQSSQDDPSSSVEECVHKRHDLPFSSGSPTWMQGRVSRASAEERMAKLVKTLESEVIPRLVEAHRSTHQSVPVAVECVAPQPADINAFVQLTLGADESAAMRFVDERIELGVPIEAACLELLAPAATQLGVMWEEDLCDFNAVTLGVGRLQQILCRLSSAFVSEEAFPANARRIALVSAPGEQHTFGLSMVAEFFLHAGWDVMAGHGGPRDEAEGLVAEQWFDVIGFSVGSETRLDWLTSCIKAVRDSSCNPRIGVMVGGPIFSLNPEYATLVGADATSGDAKQAPIVAAGIVSRLVNPRI